MGGKARITVAILFGTLMAGNLPAAERPSAALGEKLFRDPTLGGNAKSCNTCHPDGKGVEDAGTRPDLAQVINRCISGPLAGNKIPEDSTEMQSLILYIRSLEGRSQERGR